MYLFCSRYECSVFTDQTDKSLQLPLLTSAPYVTFDILVILFHLKFKIDLYFTQPFQSIPPPPNNKQ